VEEWRLWVHEQDEQVLLTVPISRPDEYPTDHAAQTAHGCAFIAAENRQTYQATPEDLNAERWAQYRLFRDIFGNPFRPVAFEPAWRTDTAIAVARQMYDSRDFGAMPILADALQDAGCEVEAILNHCRDANQPHVRGCWVVDLVLGNE
jgi:hypothetical protein